MLKYIWKYFYVSIIYTGKISLVPKLGLVQKKGHEWIIITYDPNM